jgi:hypothetical protein
LQGIWAYIFKQKGWITLLHYGRLGNLRSVRNTRRSKADTPHLPLPLVAPPPELHHFAKRESPPAAQPPMSFAAAHVGVSNG